MSASPGYKIFNPEGVYMAATKHAEDAALLATHFGDGSTVRYHGHAKRDIVWTEGLDVDGIAADSYDDATTVMHDRIDARYGRSPA